MGDGPSSLWGECRSVGSMRLFLPVAQALSPGQSEGSIIVIIATDAPLDSRQLTRLAKRAALGLARTGSTARHGSGDFMLAFSTANVIPHYPKDRTYSLTHLADTHMNPLITATVEATEEAILNALTMATTIVGTGRPSCRSDLAHQTPDHPRSPRQVARLISPPRCQRIPSLAFPSLASLSSRNPLASGGFV